MSFHFKKTIRVACKHSALSGGGQQGNEDTLVTGRCSYNNTDIVYSNLFWRIAWPAHVGDVGSWVTLHLIGNLGKVHIAGQLQFLQVDPEQFHSPLGCKHRVWSEWSSQFHSRPQWPPHTLGFTLIKIRSNKAWPPNTCQGKNHGEYTAGACHIMCTPLKHNAHFYCFDFINKKYNHENYNTVLLWITHSSNRVSLSYFSYCGFMSLLCRTFVIHLAVVD